jgi:tetratricopeptide (TPR) repeat protein
MTKKNKQKNPATNMPATQVDATQVQSLLEQFHTIAQVLRGSANQEQVEATLTTITDLPEATQLALLKTLSREHHHDAADILLALNEFSPAKDVRKEARRSLIRLQEVNIFPQWQPPVKRTALVEMFEEAQAAVNPPRFWKGVVTKSRDVGEVSLILLWEQGIDYREVRLMGFLLEFWTEGVKDFFTVVESKRQIEKFIAQMTASTETTSCSLARGRKLILEALDVDQKLGRKQNSDYRKNQALINQMILEAPDIGEETAEELADDSASSLIKPELEPQGVVTGFISAWVDRVYPLAFDHLASDSDLREGQSAQQWISHRQQWADKAKPGALIPGFCDVRESQKPKLWLPHSVNRGNTDTSKEIEAAWSCEMDDDPATSMLPELPKATAFYKENNRYWFWASFTLVKEENGWRIQSMSDEGANAQSLSVKELQARIKAEDKIAREITSKHAPTDPDALEYLVEVMKHTIKPIYYDDILITKLPFDAAAYMDAASRSMMLGELERSLVYLERMVEQFPQRKGELLLQIAATQIRLSEGYYELDDDEELDDEDDMENVVESDPDEAELDRGEHFYELGKTTLEEALSIDNNATGHILLADLLIDNGDADDFDEAEDHLLQAQTLTTTPGELAHIEYSFGEIDIDREQYEHALRHFQQVLEISPTYPNVWFHIGKIHQALGDDPASIAAFQQAIQLQPEFSDNYAELADIYIKSDRLDEARAVLNQGLKAIPNSAHLYVLLSATYLADDLHRAEELLEKAESLDPDMPIVQMFRQLLDAQKQQPESAGSHSNRGRQGKKSKKR